ncbi:MAG: substrate-binding domain-containing protein [Erysipelotrichaceae bacterium]|nr:substrate-binding domain-containing protein [Erysipelotrichaceae bacterium]
MKIIKRILLIIIVSVLLIVGGFAAYIHITRKNAEKYGHGFDYMHGYSTTDFTGYHVYDCSKLATLDHTASLTITDTEDMLVLDGAEACYPVYSAIAKAVYANIGEIEKDYHDRAEEYWNGKGRDKYSELMNVWFYNGRYVTFSNTVRAYERLVDKQVDMVFAARPSEDQKQYAYEQFEQIMSLPIGREAFIFFVEEDNPIDNLTSEQIRAIYHGDITNWKNVGGKNQKIVAFQRPENSGSQVMMKWFMQGLSLQEPKTYEYIGGMGEVIKEVAEYANEKGAIGYTFRYFLTGLNQNEHVKILSIDGIAPTDENIRNGSYPAVVNLVCAYLASNDKPYLDDMLEFLLSDDGQYLIEKTGYAPLADRNVTPIEENELRAPEEVNTYYTSNGSWTIEVYGDFEEGQDFALISYDYTYRGTINVYDKEIDDTGTRYSIIPYDGSFEMFVYYDPVKESLTVRRTDIIKEGNILPELQTEFVKK